MNTKILCILCFLFSQSINAQLNGNKKEATKEISFSTIESIDINLNVSFNIYANSSETKVVIQSEENIIDYINLQNDEGKLSIDQSKWISFNRPCIIDIYTDDLELLNNDSWSVVNIYDIEQKALSIISTIGKVSAYGQLETLDIVNKKSDIDAGHLMVDLANVSITGDGLVILNAKKLGRTDLDDRATLQQINKTTPSVKDLNSSQEIVENSRKKIDTRFIKIQLKNNSFQHVRAYVKGPKPSGKYFSYGLSWFPMSSKKENWSIGTKLYKVGLLGHKQLLLEIKEEDEGKTINLFKNS